MKPISGRSVIMNCAIQLDSYEINSVAVTQNEAFNPNLPSHRGDVSISVDIAASNKDFHKQRITLALQTKPVKGKETEFHPYWIAIKGRGFFTVGKPCTKKEAERIVRLNGTSMLYGLLRAQVVQITALSAHGKHLLPAVNFVALANRTKAVPLSQPEKRKIVKKKS